MSGALTTRLRDDGVLVATLDVPGEKVNTLSRALFDEFSGWLDLLSAPGRPIKACVLWSAKPDNFIAGADIEDFTRVRSEMEAEELSRAGHALLGRLEQSPVPVVAAIHGSCLGGGLETALACRYRVASDDPRTALGLPEVMLGLVPGAGGTQRLPRLIGLGRALDLILTGRSLKAMRALKAGLVDEVVPRPILLERACAAALALADGRLTPVRRGITAIERLARPLIFRRARASVLEKTGGHYPAPLQAIDVIESGTAASLEAGLEREAKAFGALAVSTPSRALVSLFFATQGIKKDAGYAPGTAQREVTKLFVVGAGLMGAGIAAAATEAGALVRLRDQTPQALGKGLGYAREVFEERRRRGSLTRLEVEGRVNRIAGTLDYSGLRRAELVIEAVFEDLELKRKVLADVEARAGGGCVFASNTSSIPIGEIAAEARWPERVLGMHFFSPVPKMPLLEVVVTARTEATATATAVGFGRRLGKHVIVVRDGPGFYTTRALAAYMNEAARLLEEGAATPDVDAAMTAFGFPVGPITLLDEVGIDVGSKVAKVMHHHFGARFEPPASMARVVADGRAGRKNGRGFYAYDGKRKRPDESVYALLPGAAARRPFEARLIQERLCFAFLNEAVLCLQEGILRSPRDGDVGAVFGLGFPPFLGGPFRHLDRLGARFAATVLERLQAAHGERFRPAPLLVDHAREEKAFHP